MASPPTRISPPSLPDPEKVVQHLIELEKDAATLPPDVLGSWQAFGSALGVSLPTSINNAAASRRALRRLVS